MEHLSPPPPHTIPRREAAAAKLGVNLSPALPLSPSPTPPHDAEELWAQLATRGGIELQDSQRQLLHRYLDLLIAGNQKMNLTRIVDPAAAGLLHVGDSLTLLPLLPKGPHRLVDVGSGGGLPGMVLAIARPEVKVTLLEATRKKADFLKSTADELGLGNVTVIPMRAEEAVRDKPTGGGMRGPFDVAVARAVALLPQLAEWLLPLLKPGGVMLAMKGPKVAEEIPATSKILRRLCGGKISQIPAGLPGVEGHLIVSIPKLRGR